MARLAPPQAWRDELARAFAPRSRPRPASPALALTHGIKIVEALAQHRASLDDVQSDLASGATWRREDGRSGARYLLSGGRFALTLQEQVRQDSGARLAMVRSIAIVEDRREPGTTLPTRVTFHPGSAHADCDLAAIQRMFDALGPSPDELRRRADAALSARVQAPSGSSRLHGEIRKTYGTLGALLELLRQRHEIEGGATASGIVVEPPVAADDTEDERLWVRAAGQGRFPDEADVTTTVAGKRGPRLELVSVEDDLFCLKPGPDVIAHGTAITLEYQPAFTLERHVKALDRLLDEKVEGDWDALARLLSAPESLPTADRAATPAFYDPKLNDRQREAVSGALAAPHAFLVQGPPGTGKTTMIAELVRQLVARGERVLLLAPMHVAVDEVLQRVGEKPGVFALRTSYSDSKVREDLRRFLPQNVASEFVRRGRRPETSKASIWLEQAARGATADAAVRELLAARRAEAAGRAAYDQATRDHARRLSSHAEQRVRLEAAGASAQDNLTSAQIRAQATEDGRSAAAAAFDGAATGRSVASRVGLALGLGEQARLRRALDAAGRQANDAADDMARQTGQLAAAQAAQHAFAEAAAAEQHNSDRACRERERALAERRTATAAATQSARQACDGRDPAASSDAALQHMAQQARTRAERTRRYVDLERRWFEAIGLGGHGAASEQHDRRLAELGRSLLQGANLVCCTTTGFGGSREFHGGVFDTLIVDEASRVVDSAFLIGATRARRWILVGDEHQLPPYVEPDDEHHLHALTALHMAGRRGAASLGAAVEHLAGLWREEEELHRFRVEAVVDTAERLSGSGLWGKAFEEAFQRTYARLGDDAERRMLGAMREHLVRSLFERAVARCPASARARLVEQRRMIDPIARIVRGPIYDGQYQTAPERQLAAVGVTPLVGDTFTRPIVVLDTSDQPNARDRRIGTGFVNELEVKWIVQCCRIWDAELTARGNDTVTVSVLSFYAAQAAAIRRALGGHPYRDFRVLRFQVVEAIDRIQGQESDLVLLSFCRTRRGGRLGPGYGLWLQDVRRLNVACTRARRAVVLVGHRQTLSRLRGNERAELFYRSLFELVDEGRDALVLKHMDVP